MDKITLTKSELIELLKTTYSWGYSAKYDSSLPMDWEDSEVKKEFDKLIEGK